jgi:hypothetical protein
LINTKWENKLKTKKISMILTGPAIIALILLMFAVYVEPAKAAEQITIVNHQGFLDSTGYYVVYGEVKNTGDTPAKNVGVKITFLSSSGDDVDEMDVELRTILPGRKSPFMGSAGVQGSTVTGYRVELMDLTMSAEDMPKVLEIVSAQSEVTMINMMITGTVKNNGAETSTYTRVYATAYDGPSGTGNVVAVTSGTAQPYNVDAGQTGTFQIGFFMTTGKSYTSMVIVAESDQYAATTEYVAAMGQTSTTTPSNSVAPTSQASSAAPSSSASINPSPSIPEFSPFIAIPLLIAGMIAVAVVIKKKRL